MWFSCKLSAFYGAVFICPFIWLLGVTLLSPMEVAHQSQWIQRVNEDFKYLEAQLNLLKLLMDCLVLGICGLEDK